MQPTEIKPGANLQNADLRSANLYNANLRGVDWRYADLRRANLQVADLRKADLRCANLQGANLQGANLQGADLRAAILQEANLRCANLQGVNLYGAYLKNTILRRAKLQRANLQGADLQGADLQGATGLITKHKYLKQFEKTNEGYIVYKSFGDHYPPPSEWSITPGSVITDAADTDRRQTCGYGIGFATRYWCKRECKKQIWKCLLAFEDVKDLIVPYATDGKARCTRLKILEVMK